MGRSIGPNWPHIFTAPPSAAEFDAAVARLVADGWAYEDAFTAATFDERRVGSPDSRGGDFGRLTCWLWRYSPLDSIPRRMVLSLIGVVLDLGQEQPTPAYLVRATGLTLRTIRRYIADMVEQELVEADEWGTVTRVIAPVKPGWLP